MFDSVIALLSNGPIGKFCQNNALVAVYLYSLLITSINELIIYTFSYARPETRALDAQLAQIELTLKSKLKSGDYKERDIEKLSDQFKEKTAELSKKMILPNLVSLPIMFTSTAMMMRYFGNRVIGELPFEPAAWVRYFTSRGVETDNARAFTFTFWYLICVSFNGSILKVCVNRIRQPGVKDISMLPDLKMKRE